jgi:hypothetical protein
MATPLRWRVMALVNRGCRCEMVTGFLDAVIGRCSTVGGEAQPIGVLGVMLYPPVTFLVAPQWGA